MLKNTLIGSLIAILVPAGLAWSAPTVQVKGGQTTFVLEAPVMAALEGCELQRVKPGVVKPQGDQLRLAVTGGVLDRETLLGEINHSGGLSLSCFGGESSVSLQNFRLDTSAEAWEISAVVAIDGDWHQRLPVLVPVGEPNLELADSGLLRLRGLEVTLTQDIADLLLSELGLGASTTDVVGVVSSRVKLRSADKPAGGKEGKEKEKVKDDDDGDDKEDDEQEDDDD